MKVARLKDGGCAALHGGIQVGDRVMSKKMFQACLRARMQRIKLCVGLLRPWACEFAFAFDVAMQAHKIYLVGHHARARDALSVPLCA